MNYEALGRYTEAVEKLAPLINEMKQHAQTIKKAADTLPFELNEMWTTPHTNPKQTLMDIDTATVRFRQLLEEAEKWARTANQNAEQCGKPKLNILTD